MTSSSLRTSGIWDNHHRGSISDFLKGKILQGSDLSFVSAYFTIDAYAALKDQLDQIDHLRFLFGEPQFIQSLDPDKTEKKAFRIEDDALLLSNRLEQRRVAKECSDWLKSKIDVRSIIKPGFLHGKMYHMDNNGVQEAIIGSSNFTARGLGLGASGNNIELNLEVDSTRDRKGLKNWFDEVIDLEEMDDNVSLSEFTLDDFRVELMNFLANNRKLLEEAPLGLYAVTPTLNEMKDAELFDKNWHEIVKPGVVFCLRHKNPPQEKRSSNVNPLGRYYLLYIRDDGTVRFTFTQAKNALSMVQKLSVGKTAPYQTLCDLFDQETESGAKMEKYSGLLAKAINAIVRTFRKRTAAGLQSGRDFVIPDKQEQATDASDFELITWLVIKSGKN